MWNSEEFEEFRIPLAGMDIVEHGAGSITDVGGVEFALGQLPDEPCVDRAERQLAGVGESAGTGYVVEDPRDFCSGEVCIDKQSRALLNQRLATVSAQALAEIGGAAVLPDDRVVHRHAAFAVPDDCRLALIGDADGGNVSWAGSQFVESFHSDRDLLGGELLR